MSANLTTSRAQLRRRFEVHAFIPAAPAEVFRFLDDHSRLVSHMSRRSWTMGGGHMVLETDAQRSRGVGSSIHLFGRAFGIALDVREVVSEYAPPRRKVWETTGAPRLVVIAHYRLGFELHPEARGSVVHVFIDYALPEGGVTRWLGAMFGSAYAKWCVQRMLSDASAHFQTARGASGEGAASPQG